MYRIPVEVASGDVKYAHTPVAVALDFSAALPGVPVQPETVAVWQGERRVPHRLSDGFRYGRRGEVYFVVEDPEALRYTITVSTEATEGSQHVCYVPAIGTGDPLHHNIGRAMPLPVGWGPQVNDLEGNGRAHLTCGTHWYTYFGWPGNVIHHRVAADVGELTFGPVGAVRARMSTDGEPEIISEDFYIRHHIVDWDGNGRPDLVTVNSGAKEVKLYRNTGAPGPVFEWVKTYPTRQTSGYLGVQMVDLFRDERLHLVVGGNEHLPGHEKEPYTSFIQHYENQARPGELPRFGPPERLKTADGPDIRFEGTGWSFVFTDLDGDGHPDLLYSRSAGPLPLVWYRNLGPYDAGVGPPVFRLEGPPESVDDVGRDSVRLGWAQCGDLEGPVVQDKVYRIRTDRGVPILHSPTAMKATNPEVNGGGQAWPHPSDWGGGLDLVAGDSRGHVQLFRRIGTPRWPAYEAAVRLESGNEAIRIWRNGVFGGNHWHGAAGYTTPVYADWDGDGVPDLVVANETNRVFWFRNGGTRERPAFGPRQQIEVEGLEDSAEKRARSLQLALGDSAYPFQDDEAFWWRQKVSVVDWNGNGLPDLVAVDGSGCYVLYERFRDAHGALKLRLGRRFTYQTGEPVTHDSLPRRVPGTDGIVVCDWKGRGVWDVLVGTCYTVLYLENRGDNAAPVFAKPVRLRLWGKEIHHSRHGLKGHAVDWDGDGRLSWVAGSESGMFFLFRRAALDAEHPPRVKVGRAEEVTGGGWSPS